MDTRCQPVAARPMARPGTVRGTWAGRHVTRKIGMGLGGLWRMLGPVGLVTASKPAELGTNPSFRTSRDATELRNGVVHLP